MHTGYIEIQNEKSLHVGRADNTLHHHIISTVSITVLIMSVN